MNRLVAYLFRSVCAGQRWCFGDEVAKDRQEGQEAQRQANHLRHLEVPDVRQQQPQHQEQGCGQQQLRGSQRRHCVELLIKICKAGYS